LSENVTGLTESRRTIPRCPLCRAATAGRPNAVRQLPPHRCRRTVDLRPAAPAPRGTASWPGRRWRVPDRSNTHEFWHPASPRFDHCRRLAKRVVRAKSGNL